MLPKIFCIPQICFENYVCVLFLKYENIYLSQVFKFGEWQTCSCCLMKCQVSLNNWPRDCRVVYWLVEQQPWHFRPTMLQPHLYQVSIISLENYRWYNIIELSLKFSKFEFTEIIHFYLKERQEFFVLFYSIISDFPLAARRQETIQHVTDWHDDGAFIILGNTDKSLADTGICLTKVWA